MSEIIKDASAVILVGGEGRRMGSVDKAGVVLNGKSLLERVLNVVEPLFTEVIISAHTDDYDAGNKRVVADILEGRGPALGVCSALDDIKSSWLFVVSCDLPELNPEVVRLLAGYRDGYDAVLPFANDRYQANCAFYSKKCLQPLTAEVMKGRRSLVRFLTDTDGLKVRIVGEEELRRKDPELKSFRDIDTPEELIEAESYIKDI